MSDSPKRRPWSLVERLAWGLALAVLVAMLALTAGRETVIAWLHTRALK